MEIEQEREWLAAMRTRIRAPMSAADCRAAVQEIADRRALWAEAEFNEFISAVGHRELKGTADSLQQRLNEICER